MAETEDRPVIGWKKIGRRIVFMILLILAVLICAALFELGKNTIWGWVLAAAAFTVFVSLRADLADGFAPRAALWAGLIAALLLIGFISAPPERAIPAVTWKNPAPSDIVTVAQGQVQGVRTADDVVEVFTGIPYAKPPVGELRWRPPQEPDAWEGVRICDHFAPMSMQVRTNTIFASLTEIAVYHTFRFSLRDNYIEPMSEDSLYLNVWRPTGAKEKMPVLVFIHGGSLTTGQPSYGEYNGESFARKGVIVVNFGYRLNAFGYLALEELAEESGTTGNYGLLDQIAALKWVHENIAAFGGDPDAVTVCGESAGASSVNALCVSPLAEGLFRYAIAESSGITAKRPYHTFRSYEKAIESDRAIFQKTGASTVEELRRLDAKKLVNSTNSAMTVDGYAITEQPYLTYERGANHEQALLSGFNRHEADLFTLFTKVTAEDYTEKLAPVLGELAGEAASLCPPTAQDERYRLFVDAGGDAKGSYDRVYSAAWFAYSHYNWSRLVAAEDRPVYEYTFTKDNGSLGSNHGGEMPYVFGNLHRHAWLYDSADEALSMTMLHYWVNFVRTGNPNGDGLPRWPRFADDPTQVQELGVQVGPITDPNLALYELIDRYQDAAAEQ